MTKIWLKLQLHFSQKTTTKTKLKSAVKINTAEDNMFWSVNGDTVNLCPNPVQQVDVHLFFCSFHQRILQKTDVSWFPQKYEAHDCFENNQKCFLSSKSVYYNDFWIMHWRLE